MSDLPYDPLQSPSSENLPPFPASSDSDPVLGDQQPDYDAQIQQLQMELDRSKSEIDGGAPDGGGGGEEVEEEQIQATEAGRGTLEPPPAYVERIQDDSTAALHNNNHVHGNNIHDTSSSTSTTSPETAATSSQQQSGGSASGLMVCKAVTFSLLAAFFLFLITVLCVLECEELEFPLLSTLRELPGVQDFKQQHYNPFKTTVMQKMGGWYKT